MSYRREGEIGSRPDADRPSAFAYGNEVVNSNSGLTYGYEGGFGINSGLLGTPEGWHASSTLLSGNGFAGARMDDDGTAWHGAGAHAKVAGFDVGYGNPGDGWFGHFAADALGADAEASFNPDKGAQLGATAYLVQGALEGGHLSADSQHDQIGRFGLAAGVGAAGRLHWDDADGDGIREIGFGADIGPVTFDFKSETLGQGYQWLEDNVPAAWDASTDWVGDAWDTSTDWVGDTWSGATDGIADGWNTATDWAGDTWTGATDAVGDAWGTTTDAVASGWNTATDWVGGGLSSAGSAIGSFFSGW